MKLLFVKLGFCLLLLGACSQRFEPYFRFNKPYQHTGVMDTLLADMYFYCGNAQEWKEPGVESFIYKDTIINMLFRSLKKDTLVKVGTPKFIEHVKFFNKPNRQLKYIVDSVIHRITTKEKRLIPIVYHTRFEHVNTVNAIHGSVSRMYNNILYILFYVKDESGVQYINGQVFWWIESDMHFIPKYLKQEHLDKLLAKGLRKYKKAIRKSKQKSTPQRKKELQ